MGNENQLLEQKELRESVIGRIEVLDKVGDLLMLGNTDYATTSQVATYYGVDESSIRQIIARNSDELLSDGLKTVMGKELKGILASDNMSHTNHKGYFIADGQKFANGKNTLFLKRAILRIGMLLRDSEVAKEIRTRLLDIVHDASNIITENGNTIVENVVEEITEERQLMIDRVDAEMQGDYDTVSIINAKLFAIKNKRIKELEVEVENITTHKLILTESRDVINRLVRLIANKDYNGLFGKAFNELYSKVNYKLGINIKARNGKGSILHRLTEDETYKTEEIVRTWANKIGIDVEKELSL